MTFHHVGCAVRDLEQSLHTYGALGTRRSRAFDVASQNVRVCFVELSPGVYLELVQGASPSPLDRFLAGGFYHLCFLVDDLGEAIAAFPGRVAALPAFASEAFAGHTCQFLITAEQHLIELAQMPPAAFAAHFESCLAQ